MFNTTRPTLTTAVLAPTDCNGQTAQTCGAAQVATVASLREVLPSGMPIFLEETGSSAGPYDPTHDETFEAAFVVPYVAAMAPAELRGAHWWVSSDLCKTSSPFERTPSRWLHGVTFENTHA